MSIDEMREYLIGIQKELPETKILNILLTQQQQIEVLRKALIEIQNAVNEIIKVVNRGAAALNPDIPEDKEETAPVE